MAGKIIADTIETGAGADIATSYVVNGSAKAWVRMDMVGTPTTAGNLNISSLTDLGVGEVFPNVTNAFADLHYATVGGSNGAGVANFAGLETRRETTSQINMRGYNTSTNSLADFYFIYCAVFGDLA